LSIITQNRIVLELDWIISEPIDFEYKQYQLLGYLQKIDKEFDEFKLYPAFKELSLHLANIKSVSSDNRYISLNREIRYIDEEIVMGDLDFKRVPNMNEDEIKEFNSTVSFAESKITDYFMIGKSLWSVINDSISLLSVQYKSNIRENFGFVTIMYDGLRYVYQYELRSISPTSTDKVMEMENIYVGDGLDIHSIILENCIMDDYAFKARFESVSLPIFEFLIEQKFDFEHSLKPLVKRKVLSYISQNTRIGNVKF
jgi:hypothetical protein